MSLVNGPPTHPFVLTTELQKYITPSAAEDVWRFHGHEAKTGLPYGPVHFSKADTSRWNSSGGPGVLCVGRTFAGSLLEYFSRDWPSVLEPTTGLLGNRRALSHTDQTETYATRLRMQAGLKLYDLTKLGALNSLGLDGHILTTKEYHLTRPWSQWFSNCPQLDGLVHSSRPAGARAINYVLFQRTGLKARLEASAYGTKSLLGHQAELKRAAKRLNIFLLPAPHQPRM